MTHTLTKFPGCLFRTYELYHSAVRKLTLKTIRTINMSEMDKFVQLSSGKQISHPAEVDWRNHVLAACQSLKDNEVIAVPTDTIYGIACLAQSTSAVDKIYKIKKRDELKPVAICVGDVQDVSKWCQVTVSPELLAELLPGPVTTVFERKPLLNLELNPDTSLVGVRVPDYGFVRDVVRECQEPLALTSANVTCHQSTVSVQEFSDLWPQLGRVFDGGILGVSAQDRLGSTVVDLSKQGRYTVLRDGSAFSRTVELLKKYGLEET